MSKHTKKHSGGFLDLDFSPNLCAPPHVLLGVIFETQNGVSEKKLNFSNFFNDLRKIRLDFQLKL